MLQQTSKMSVRSDSAGDGKFGASRGSRTHNGIDYVCLPGSELLCPIHGRVTKLGYPYGDDLVWRYVQITDSSGVRHRFFYVEPEVEIGEWVVLDQPIGLAQDISQRYPGQGMTPHVHYEVMLGDNTFVNPEEYDCG